MMVTLKWRKRQRNSGSKTSFQVYLSELRRVPLLSFEEEMTHAKNAGMGDQKAKSRLIEANLAYVVSVAKKVARERHVPYLVNELVQYGNIGLVIATEKFDYSRGVPFKLYAQLWIREEMTRYLDNSGSIRIPVHMEQMMKRVNNSIRRLKKSNPDSEPTLEQLADMVNAGKKRTYTPEQIRDAQTLYRNARVTSLDAELGDSEYSYHDTLSATRGVSASEIMEDIQMVRRLRKVIDGRLDSQQKKVIGFFYDLPSAPATLGKPDRAPNQPEIGRYMGITRQRVMQLRVAGENKIRAAPELATVYR